jgi:hypothetical protein
MQSIDANLTCCPDRLFHPSTVIVLVTSTAIGCMSGMVEGTGQRIISLDTASLMTKIECDEDN